MDSNNENMFTSLNSLNESLFILHHPQVSGCFPKIKLLIDSNTVAIVAVALGIAALEVQYDHVSHPLYTVLDQPAVHTLTFQLHVLLTCTPPPDLCHGRLHDPLLQNKIHEELTVEESL